MAATSNMPDLRCDSEVAHQLVERRRHRSPHFVSQMRVNGRGARTAIAQVVLNDAQIEARFQQMCGVAVPHGVHMGVLVAATPFDRPAEGTLHTAAAAWTPIVRQTMTQ